MHSLPPTPPEDYDDPLSLIQPIAGLSLDLGHSTSTSWIPSFSSFSSPASYDPMSPSYDPCAASPCNPFPSSSPFSSFTFTRPRASSRLRFDDSYGTEVLETSTMQTQAIPQSSPQSLAHAAALSRIPPPHSAPSLRRTKPCRFYLDPAGCKSGRWCNFKHPVGASSEDRSLGKSNTLDELRAAVVRSRPANGTACENMGVWDDVPDVRDLDPDWGKKNESDVHPKWRTQPCRNFLLGMCRYGDNCQFIHAPGLFPSTASDAYPTSLPLPVTANMPPNNLTSLPLPLPISIWGAHPSVGVPADAGPPEGASGGKPEQMSLYYRTKPCKYFDNDGTCPHGADCKFIHDPKKSTPSSAKSEFTPPPPIMRGPSWADDDRELDFEETPCFMGMEVDCDESERGDCAAMQDMTNDDVRKSTSMRRRDRARARSTSQAKKKNAPEIGGIFKPTWRVVGGGVMLAGGEKHDLTAGRTAEDEDSVLEHQPRDLDCSVIIPAFPDDSPLEYAHAESPFSTNATAIPVKDDTEYGYDYTPFTIDPAQYPPNELLRPPSPNMSLEIVMGNLEGWNATVSPRKKRMITGADLMRGIKGPGTSQDVSPQAEKGGVSSQQREREKPRPHLTIAVPSFTHSHRRTQSHGVKGPAGYTPYPYPQPRRVGMVAARTDTGDDVLDWGEDEEPREEGDEGQILTRSDGEEIRRVRSTPPTPRSSASFLDVPIMPRLPAESP